MVGYKHVAENVLLNRILASSAASAIMEKLQRVKNSSSENHGEADLNPIFLPGEEKVKERIHFVQRNHGRVLRIEFRARANSDRQVHDLQSRELHKSGLCERFLMRAIENIYHNKWNGT